MSRSPNRASRKHPPLRGRLAAIASPKLRTQYSQAATYTNISRPTSRPTDFKTAGFKLIDSQATIIEDNSILVKEELIDVPLPVIEMEAPQVEVLKIEISELKAPEVEILEVKTPEVEVPGAREVRINDSPSSETQLSKAKPPEVKLTEKSEQFEQAEKRLLGFVVFFLVLFTIGSSL